MKQIPAYVCEKCGYFELGEENAQKVEKHERMPITARCNSLDGLIVQTIFDKDYLVVRQMPFPTQKHEARYSWKVYLRKNLKAKYAFPEELEKLFRRIISDTGFPASHILNTVLYRNGSENAHKDYTELPEAEFQRVAKKLKQIYPELYSHTEFKRELKQRRQSHHSKK